MVREARLDEEEAFSTIFGSNDVSQVVILYGAESGDTHAYLSTGATGSPGGVTR
jgi:hypothetical protein